MKNTLQRCMVGGYFFIIIDLLRYADSAGLADNRDTNLTWISHLVLNTLSDIK